MLLLFFFRQGTITTTTTSYSLVSFLLLSSSSSSSLSCGSRRFFSSAFSPSTRSCSIIYKSSASSSTTSTKILTRRTMMSYVTSSDPVPSEELPSWMLAERTRMLTSDKIQEPKKKDAKSIVYWMQRDVRTVDNWALLFAGHLAETYELPLHVVHVLDPPASKEGRDGNSNNGNDNSNGNEDIPTLETMGMTERLGKFVLGGLQLVHEELEEKSVPLHVLRPLSHRLVKNIFETDIMEELSPAVIICDFVAIRHLRRWMEIDVKGSCEKFQIPLWQVDTHNVVPVWYATDKKQVGARTLRPKLHKVVGDFLQKYPKFKGNDHLGSKQKQLDIPSFDYDTYEHFMDWDTSVKEVPNIKPGTKAAQKQFESFVSNGLGKFDQLRNDPNYTQICSNLSPWLNRGHIAFQRCIMAVKKLNKHSSGSSAYIEEGLVRKELSDNFLFYAPDDYDKLTGAAGWAQETLDVHANDDREYVYTLEELEQGKTHEDLWNAAQLQVVREGGMHGFMRMYWAKKILEWTESPEVALKTAQYFNDKYALDGRCPNGFVGVGWSIMGIHDQGWKEREIFGKIRYMNYNGCKRKFKVGEFVDKYKGAAENAEKAEKEHSETKRSQKKRKSPSQ